MAPFWCPFHQFSRVLKVVCMWKQLVSYERGSWSTNHGHLDALCCRRSTKLLILSGTIRILVVVFCVVVCCAHTIDDNGDRRSRAANHRIHTSLHIIIWQPVGTLVCKQIRWLQLALCLRGLRLLHHRRLTEVGIACRGRLHLELGQTFHSDFRKVFLHWLKVLLLF